MPERVDNCPIDVAEVVLENDLMFPPFEMPGLTEVDMSIVEGVESLGLLHESQLEELIDLDKKNVILKDEELTSIIEEGKMLCSSMESDMQNLYYDAFFGAAPLEEATVQIDMPTHFHIDSSLFYNVKTEEHTFHVNSTDVMAGCEVITHSDVTMHTPISDVINTSSSSYMSATPMGRQSLPSIEASFKYPKTLAFLENKTVSEISAYTLPILQVPGLKRELSSVSSCQKSKKTVSQTTPKFSLPDSRQRFQSECSTKSNDSGLGSECSSPPSSPLSPMSEATSSGDELVMDIPSPSTRRGRKGSSGRSKRKTPQLWQFLLEVLTDRNYNPCAIKWVDKNAGTFRFVKSQQVAQLWGARRNRKGMTYEFLSRALRHYYKRGIMSRISTKRLHYKFGDGATGWREYAQKSP